MTRRCEQLHLLSRNSIVRHRQRTRRRWLPCPSAAPAGHPAGVPVSPLSSGPPRASPWPRVGPGPIPACPRRRLPPDSWGSDREVGLPFLPAPLPPASGWEWRSPVASTGRAIPGRRRCSAFNSLYDRVKGAWEERFERSYGFWRGLVDEVVARYLDCGIWESGLARFAAGGAPRSSWSHSRAIWRRTL